MTRHENQTAPKQGFAIIVALALMGFILVLLLGLTSFVRVEAMASDATLSRLKAKQNAYLSAMLALGELQKHTGPDQRVTARAEIFDRDNELISPAATTGNQLDENRYWTGVWSSKAPDPSTLEPGTPETFPLPGRKEAPIKNQPVQTWLISDLPTTLSDSDREDYPLDYISGPNSVALYRGIDINTTADDIRLNPTLIGDESNGDSGHFAWWVSDEGVKASVNPNESPPTPGPDQKYSLASIRMAPEVVANSAEGIDLSSLDAESDYGRLPSLQKLANLLDAEGYPTEEASQVPRLFFHDLTLNHQALLTNVRDGGLKQDLSVAFASDAQFNDFIDNNGVLLFGPAEKTSGNYDDATAFDPLTAGIGSSAYRFGYDNPRDAGGPTWDQFRSFFNSTTTASSVTPRPQTETQSGIYPVISHAQLITYLAIYDETPTGETTNYTVRPRLCLFPAIVLWNPYDVALEVTEYQIQIVPSDNLDMPFYSFYNNNSFEGNFYDDIGTAQLRYRPLRFTLTTELAPGEAKIFTPQQITPLTDPTLTNPTAAQTNLLSEGIRDGAYLYKDASDTLELPANESPYRLHLRAHTPSGRESKASICLGMNGFSDNGNNYSITDMLQIAGTFESSLTTDSVGNLDHYNESDFLSPGTEVLPPAALTSNLFPSTYFYIHLRLTDNFMQPRSLPQNKVPMGLLAHRNPRASYNTALPSGWNGGGPDDNQIYHQSFHSVNGTDIRDFLSVINPDASGRISIGQSDYNYLNASGRITLFQIPKTKHYFSSISSLTHANLSTTGTSVRTLIDIKDWDINNYNSSLRSTTQTSTHPSYSIGNSLADPYIPVDALYRKGWINRVNNLQAPDLVHADWSYLLNDTLWDTYCFSGYDGDSALPEAINPRIRPRGDWSTNFPAAELGDYSRSAGEFVVNGAFNINSTSVEAWKAFLSGMRGQDFSYGSNNTFKEIAETPYSRVTGPKGAPIDGSTQYEDENFYNGFRTLTDDQIEELAEAMVAEVKKRGPFRSLAHFINRSVKSDEYSSEEELAYGINAAVSSTPEISPHYKGAVAAALAQTSINKEHYNSGDPEVILDSSVDYDGGDDLKTIDPVSLYGETTAHYPGYLAQSDILAQVGDAVTARSDSFKIRAYGDSINSLTGDSTGAVCEMIVQRSPEYVDSADDVHIAPDNLTSSVNQRFGRQYQIISFRWLAENEI